MMPRTPDRDERIPGEFILPLPEPRKPLSERAIWRLGIVVVVVAVVSEGIIFAMLTAASPDVSMPFHHIASTINYYIGNGEYGCGIMSLETGDLFYNFTLENAGGRAAYVIMNLTYAGSEYRYAYHFRYVLRPHASLYSSVQLYVDVMGCVSSDMAILSVTGA